MKLTTAINRLTKAGYEIHEGTGTYAAMKDGDTISFYETAPGSGKTGRFTFMGAESCAPTYGMTLKAAMA
ncbi:MAG: hypothetical protein GWN00_01010 [Aliifodinibius sp.]|nr:hypothetical protein [Fodinibius sp.]NIV09910.1 hypothetical protein [Fodinibius sp.]NIY23440.1 hypothetical protein [Fodinibius sp.]